MRKNRFTAFAASCAILLLTLLALPSCENFHENNGDLGGMWQLTQWTQLNADGSTTIKATNEDGIYYSVHREIIQYTHFGPEKAKQELEYSRRYFSMFRHTADSLIIYNIVNAKDEETLVEASELKEYGIPEDGHFLINHLDADEMTLSYDKNILKFRKY